MPRPPHIAEDAAAARAVLAPAPSPARHHAHTARDASGKLLPEECWQRLHVHLQAVSDIVVRFAGAMGLSDEKVLHEARLVGLLHDLGKYRAAFQEYLRGGRPGGADTRHAIYGALHAETQGQPSSAFAIAGHHAGLHDLSSLQAALEQAGKGEDAARLCALLESDLPGALIQFPGEPAHVARVGAVSETAAMLAFEFHTRMLFSCLVDADRLDSALWPESPPDDIPLDSGRLLDLVRAERDRKRAANPDSPMSTARNAIFDACVRAGEWERGFFSLTVPTGGGKTLAAMAFALAHAHAHQLRRVIVVIPYLSIIEQNAAEYRRVLDPANTGIVLENHSSVKPDDNAGEDENGRLELISENWDAPVVVTTSVQFIESLFAASPSRARKLHRVARSVVIFDEVQTLPTHLLTPMFSVLRELAANYGTSFVFSSATQPAFLRGSAIPDGFTPGELREIIPEPSALFHQLRRVNYHFHNEPLPWEALARKLAASPSQQTLCVVNLTRHARELWEALNRELAERHRWAHEGEEMPRAPRPIHLSSAMCPAHRLALIRRIRQRLKAGQPCHVVATQLVEAGVDVDFPEVWRAMGPLDSIAQVAGRCNREGRRPAGEVHIFTPEDNKLPPGIYSTATGQTEVMLRSLGENAAGQLATDPAVFGRYFNMLFGLVDTDHAKRGENTIQKERENLRFRTVAERARVIQDNGRPVVIPIGKARRHIAAIRARKPDAGRKRFTRDDLRRLQRHMVNVRTHHFLKLQARELLHPLLPNLEIFILQEGDYHKELGLLVETHPPEDFLQ
ncbi:MAG: CRISPR-associated endonuclease Cas3'' [Puniceicoccales bacterium]|nr:CRISPR-associated endonuclease Cas3'' [Puniceicoccales bacterium]